MPTTPQAAEADVARRDLAERIADVLDWGSRSPLLPGEENTPALAGLLASGALRTFRAEYGVLWIEQPR